VSILEPKNIFDNQKFKTDDPAKDKIYISEKFKVMRVSLKKGLEIEPHEGSHPAVFLVMKGKAIFPTASGEETEPRGIKSLEDLTVLVIRD